LPKVIRNGKPDVSLLFETLKKDKQAMAIFIEEMENADLQAGRN
jgi:phenylpyruvate tautomerase PptA (4-oxalocrotonate tautomerase family)